MAPQMSFARGNWHKIALFIVIITLLWQGVWHFGPFKTMVNPKHSSFDDWCQLPDTDSHVPSNDNLSPSLDLTTEASLKLQVERLSAAVECSTESFDDHGDVDVENF